MTIGSIGTVGDPFASARARFWVLLAVALCVFAENCAAQPHIALTPDSAHPRYTRTVPVVRFGYLSPELKSTLAARWDVRPTAVERAYCITRWTVDTVYAPSDSAIEIVFKGVVMQPATVDRADGYSVTYECPDHALAVHTHPPHTQLPDGTMVRGGWDADQCQPSATDYRTLVRSRDPAAVVLCGPTQARWYYPQDFGGK